MIPILKYPRTPHIAGSRLQPGDEDLGVIAPEVLEAGSLVIEEKLDGSNSGISFDRDGSLVLQSRGHVLTGGPREHQFNLLKRWANHYVAALRDILAGRYVMYGEWLYARHTIAYNQLPHYFLEFDMFDKDSGEFLSTERRASLLAGGPVLSVPVLGTGSVGPVVVVEVVDTPDEAIAAANRTLYGLTSSILAGNTYRAFEMAPKVLAGIVNVNSPTVNDEIHAPMGGVRDSGWGRTGSRSLDDFSDVIWINSHSGQRQYPF